MLSLSVTEEQGVTPGEFSSIWPKCQIDVRSVRNGQLVLPVAGLRHRRFRVIATVAGGFAAAAALTAVIMYLTGQGALGPLTAGLRRHSWRWGRASPIRQ